MDTQEAMPADVESILQPTSELFPDPVAAPPIEQASQPVPQAAPQPSPTVPLPELLEQRHARQLAEQKAQFLERQLAEYRQAQEAQYRQHQPQPQPIDPIADPEGFARAVAQENAILRQQMQQLAPNIQANVTEMLVREKYGDQAVDEAVAAAHQAGLGQHFMRQSNPYKALMDWNTSQSIAKQVGPDLKAWEAKKEAEIEARIMERMRAGRPAPQNLPPSLASATKANAGLDVIEDASTAFRSIFAKPNRT